MLVSRVKDAMIFVCMCVIVTLIFRPKKGAWSRLLFMLPCLAGHMLCEILEERVPLLNYFLFVLCYFSWTLIYAILALQCEVKNKIATISILCSTYNILRSIIRPLLLMLFPDSMFMWSVNLVSIIIIGFWLVYTTDVRKQIPVAYCMGITAVAFAAFIINSIEGYHYIGAASVYTYFSEVEFFALNCCHLFLLLTVYHMNDKVVGFYESARVRVFRQTAEKEERILAIENKRMTREISVIRHEMKNHLATISALLERGDTDIAKQLLKQLPESYANHTHLISSGNRVVDAILNLRMAVAADKQIKMSVEASMTEALPFTDSDISSLLSNLIDNAIEASEKVPDPWINVTIRPAKRYLCFDVRNKVAHDVLRDNPDLKTTKEHPEAHGLGIQVIKKTAEKYNGIASFQLSDYVFIAHVMLLMNPPNPL